MSSPSELPSATDRVESSDAQCEVLAILVADIHQKILAQLEINPSQENVLRIIALLMNTARAVSTPISQTSQHEAHPVENDDDSILKDPIPALLSYLRTPNVKQSTLKLIVTRLMKEKIILQRDFASEIGTNDTTLSDWRKIPRRRFDEEMVRKLIEKLITVCENYSE